MDNAFHIILFLYFGGMAEKLFPCVDVSALHYQGILMGNGYHLRFFERIKI